MAVDPSDTLDPPYGLGECVDVEWPTSASCNTMFTENSAMLAGVTLRKQGDFVQIIVPAIIAKHKAMKQTSFNLTYQMMTPGLERTEFQGGLPVWDSMGARKM